jgi:hypothetical protein
MAATEDELRAALEALRLSVPQHHQPYHLALSRLDTAITELVALRGREEIVKQIAERALERDTLIPEGATGRDKAFRLLEQMCGDMQYLAGHVGYRAPKQGKGA